jgi:predicted aminopeptidase
MRIPLILSLLPMMTHAENPFTLIPYVIEQGFKQGALLLRTQSVDDLLSDPSLDPRSESYLRLSQEVLSFAKGWGFRVGANYRRYINIQRPWVTMVVTAAKSDSLTSHLFEYPVVGRLPYKGFFDEADAIHLEETLKAKGLDTYRRGVEAYSTAGWLPDPLLSTMFRDETRLIELLFHELTHSIFYFPSEADFNEAFASWMGYQAAIQFVEQKAPQEKKQSWLEQLKRSHQRQIQAAGWVKQVIQKTNEFYKKSRSSEERKAYFEQVAKGAEHFRAPVELWNNAFLLSLATYYELVPQIDSYAQKHQLSPQQFLDWTRREGPSAVSKILAEPKP